MQVHLPLGRKKIVGVGAALVDILTRATDAFLRGVSQAKGGMTLVDNTFIEGVLEKINGEISIVSGGAACNTIVGVAALGGDARFIGMAGADRFGALFENDLRSGSVEPLLFRSPLPNGKVLSIITPDAERSMFTYLGAASELSASHIDAACFRDAAIVLVEAYLLYNSTDLVIKSMTLAKSQGALVAMDLSSYTVVEHFHAFLKEEVKNHVDILIANEEEAFAFTGLRDEREAILEMAKWANVAVIKIGKRGSLICCGDVIETIAPFGSGEAADTTGAGDLWASGFFFGLVNGWPLVKSGKIASICGYEVCQVLGAKIPHGGWMRIKSSINEA